MNLSTLAMWLYGPMGAGVWGGVLVSTNGIVGPPCRRHQCSVAVRSPRGQWPKDPACIEIGRDLASIGRSAGIFIQPTDITGAAEAMAIPIRGSAEEIADGPRPFRAGG